MHDSHRGLLASLALLVSSALAGSAAAQANLVPGIDVELGGLGPITVWGREGTFPGGVNGISMATVVCNGGTVQVPWLQAMDPDHPFIAFLVARESGGRLVQVSDRSYVKHGYYAQSSSICTPCQGGSSTGSFLGIGCSDTYSVQNNGDMYWLGPPEEIDPWLGDWNPQCSHLDRGEPPVAPPLDCDGQRSLTKAMVSALGPVGHRVRVLDSELDVPGGRFFYQGQYVVRGEAGPLRGDNLGSREMAVAWSGSAWAMATTAPLMRGTVLNQWAGAVVSSAGNGGDDGNLHVGARFEPLPNGLYHYEYAVHNQDNFRGVGALRIPLAPGATVSAAGFRDVDAVPSNDWTITQIGGEVVFSTAGDPLGWNSLYNFWFDCDAAPHATGAVVLDQFLAGPGAPSVSLPAPTPEGVLCRAPATYCTPKLNSQHCYATVSSTGSASVSATAPFEIRADDVVPGVNGLLFYSKSGPAAVPLLGGTMCLAAPVSRTTVTSSGGAQLCSGVLSFDFNAWIASGADPGLVPGQQVWGQFWYRDPTDPQQASLTDAITFAVCP